MKHTNRLSNMYLLIGNNGDPFVFVGAGWGLTQIGSVNIVTNASSVKGFNAPIFGKADNLPPATHLISLDQFTRNDLVLSVKLNEEAKQ